MTPIGRPTTLEERLAIVERWKAGESDREIATSLGISRWTVRKWRRRYQREGRGGLASSMGRPKTGALGSFPESIRQAIDSMRKAHRGWGPLTLLTELQRDSRFAGERLPSRASIALYLKEKEYTREYKRHSDLPQPKQEKPKRPHEEWEMDAQGVTEIPGLGKVSIINISDVYSSMKVESMPTSHPNAKDYQLILRRAFTRVGLPERITLDHDTVFYDSTCRSPFPSVLHLWLIALGVEVRFIHKPPPMEHSRIERMHRTIFDQAVRGQDFTGADLEALQELLWQRLEFLNRHYPSRSLGGKPPLVVFPEAQHSRRPYRPEWEAEMLDLQRVYTYLAKGRWFRKTTSKGQFELGGHRYNAGHAFAKQTLEITFDPKTREFLCTSEDGKQSIRFQAMGLSKEDLMGDLKQLTILPNYQLPLPFSRSDWREILLSNQLGGTTL